MKITSIAAAVLALGAGTNAWSADPAGRVLAVAGNATIERAGQQIPLQVGAMVENGDTLGVGDKSTLQVRFTDESVVALRANSQFKIENYKYERNAESDRSLMGLLKGGMRTITGLIGKANNKNYGVQTATATIGIRGTHFTVVSCNNDCTRPDGTPEANGTFGSVTDGRISVSNASGVKEFGQQDSFYVPTANSAPVQLLAPPAILSDKGPASRGRSTASASAQDGEAKSSSGNASGSRISTSPQLTEQRAPTISLNAPLTSIASSDQPGVVVGNLGGSNQITVMKFRGHAFLTTDSTEVNATNYSLLELRNEVNELTGAFFYNAQTLAARLQTIWPVGSSAAAQAYWMYEAPTSGVTGAVGSHHIWGDTPNITLPGTGVAQYNYAGGTAPTDNFGRTGSFTGANLSMDFANRTIKSLGAMSMSFGTNIQQTTATTYTIPTNTTWAMGGGPTALTGVVCSGCTATPTGSINGRFVGTTLQGYAAAIKLGTSDVAGPNQVNAAGNVAAFAKQ